MPKGIYATVGTSTMYYDPTQEDIANFNLILMSGERPNGVGCVALDDGSWGVTDAVIQALYEAELVTLDPLQLHIMRHERNGDTERAARAELEFEIAQAKIFEKYGKGETVLVTEGGECYHTDPDCTGLSNAVEVKEVNQSDGLENYSPCSICCN